MQTHYIPAFTRENGRTREAVCGTFVPLAAHAVEPSCVSCAEWLVAGPSREAEDEATAVALEREFPEYVGRLVTTSAAKGAQS